MRELIIGVDLHQRQASYAVIDRLQTVYAEEDILNEDRDRIRDFLLRWKQPETTITLIVEATGSWYWFVDFVSPLVDRVKLADTFWSAQCLKGRAAKNDRIDALDLAKLEVRGQIEEGYQMPRELREVRDVLRTRMRLVQERTAMKNRIRAVLTKNGIRFKGADLCGPGGGRGGSPARRCRGPGGSSSTSSSGSSKATTSRSSGSRHSCAAPIE